MRIKRVIEALTLADQTDIWDDTAMTAEFAERYLIIYAGKYPEVMTVCEEELKLQPENVRKRLEEIITKAQTYKENDAY